MKIKLSVYLAIALMAAACTEGASKGRGARGEQQATSARSVEVEPADPLKRAQAAAMEFNKRLRATLESAVENQGPAAAIEVCSLSAPAIADEVMRAHSLRLGRVAAPGKNRHPDHAAEGWTWDALAEMIEAVEAGAPTSEQVKVIREELPEGVELRMVRGIPTEALCTRCHGESIEPEIEAKLRELYPGDGATGFREGTLRGALWVEVTTM